MPSNPEPPRPQPDRPQPDRPLAHRLGPQPLPLHLSLALTTWSNSAAILPSLVLAWQTLKAQQTQNPQTPGHQTPGHQTPGHQTPGQQPGNQSANPSANGPLKLPPRLQQILVNLGPQLDAADPAALARALTDEGHRRLDAFVTGALAYRHQPTAATRPSRNVLWSSGTTRLLDYRHGTMPETAPRVLVIPSLINRYYILDLAPEQSFLDFLAKAGCQPFVIDWGAPGAVERGFGLTDYIATRLQAAYRAIANQPGGPIIVVGYCMGGLLALALTQLLLRQREMPQPAGLALLATPWDFHAEQADHAAMIAAIGRQLEPLMTTLGELPVDLLQSFFALLDPFQVPRKFQGFAQLARSAPPATAAMQRFTLLEDWLNDGTSLAADVARECLIDWYGANTTANGAWRVAGNIVDPRAVTIPSLALIPDRDRIVPPGSALALARSLPVHEIVTPPAGHIGMMAGSKARTEVWPRIATWAKQQG